MRKLESDRRLPKGITMIDGGTQGLELLSFLHDCSRLLLLDAVDTGAEPGTMIRLAGGELGGRRRVAGASDRIKRPPARRRRSAEHAAARFGDRQRDRDPRRAARFNRLGNGVVAGGRSRDRAACGEGHRRIACVVS